MTTAPSLPIPAGREPYVVARIRTHSSAVPAWAKAVDVSLRREPSLSVVGIDREE